MNDQTVSEEWREIGVNRDYAVSNLGRVKRVRSRTKGKAGHVLLPALRNGYPTVDIAREGKMKHTRIHKLVAAAFFGPQPHGIQVNHKNGIKTDNHVENLEYVTQSQNIRHAMYSLGVVFGKKRRT